MPRTKGAKANPLAKLTKRFDMEAGKSGLTNDELLAVKDMYEKGDAAAIAKMGIDKELLGKIVGIFGFKTKEEILIECARGFEVDMGQPRIITRSFTQFGVESYEGQSIEDRCKKLVETGEPIKDTSPLIYTPKDKGVMPQYDVRADKWEIAQNAMDGVNKERIAKGQQPPSAEVDKKDTAQGGALENAGQPT